MKFAAGRPYGDPEKAAREFVEIADSVESAQDGRWCRNRSTPLAWNAQLSTVRMAGQEAQPAASRRSWTGPNSRRDLIETRWFTPAGVSSFRNRPAQLFLVLRA